MNRKIVILLFALILGQRALAQSNLQQIQDFGPNPGNLEMYFYSPDTIDTPKKLPLVVALHGCSQNSKTLAETSDWNKLADRYGFHVLYPRQKRINNLSNCFNWFELDDISQNSGELQSIVNMIDFVCDNYEIDTNRVFVYGLSAGAAMGVALMAVYPAYFKAGAIFAGSPYKIATTKKDAANVMIKTKDLSPEEWGKLVAKDSLRKTYPNIIVCHGTDDPVVDISNSFELIEQWAYLHSMDTIPDSVFHHYVTETVSRYTFTNSIHEEKIIFYKFRGVGHYLPIDPGTDEKQGGSKSLFSRDIDFFSTYYICREFGLIE